MRILFLNGPHTNYSLKNDINKSLQAIRSHYQSSFTPSYKRVDSSFLLFDPEKPKSIIQKWNRNLFMVKPHYAVKCNPNPLLLTALNKADHHDLHFDCASKAELNHIHQNILNVRMFDRVILSNPRKKTIDLEAAAHHNVLLTVADCEEELFKINYTMPLANILWRINIPNDKSESCSMSTKYGASMEETKYTFSKWFKEPISSENKLSLKGVHFHMGSANRMQNSLPVAKQLIYEVLRHCIEDNIHNNEKPFVINMGGGFINKYIDEDIPFLLQWIESLKNDWPNFQFQFMAEPGRLFAEQSFSLATHVVSKRKKKNIFEYTINDSIYHSFSGIKHDGWKLDPVAQQSYKLINHQIVESHKETVHDSVLFGITCDGCDVVMPHCVLPELEIGDTLVWNNMGAYSTSSSTSFNGIEAATHTLIV